MEKTQQQPKPAVFGWIILAIFIFCFGAFASIHGQKRLAQYKTTQAKIDQVTKQFDKAPDWIKEMVEKNKNRVEKIKKNVKMLGIYSMIEFGLGLFLVGPMTLLFIALAIRNGIRRKKMGDEVKIVYVPADDPRLIEQETASTDGASAESVSAPSADEDAKQE